MKRLDETQICEINITPLTDVFLVLLIIMIVVNPMMNFAGLPLAVSTDTGEAQKTQEKKPKTLTLNVDAEGKISIKGAEIVRPILTAELQARLSSDNPEGVVVQVQPNAPYDALTFTLSAVYQAGIQRINVFEEQVDDPAAATPPPPAAPPAEPKK